MDKVLEFIEKPIKYVTDPGHGWIAVPLEILIELGIDIKVSSCSYRRNGIAYLEEDGDAGLFIDAIKNKYEGVKLKFDQRHQNNDSIIRTFDSF